jgi:superfamily I DNA and RNA helicase
METKVQKDLGAEGSLKVEVKDGKVVVSAVYDGKGADASLSIAIDSDYLLDKLAEAIPGNTMAEQLTIQALKLGLKSVKI